MKTHNTVRTSLTEEEIEANFRDIDLFTEIMKALKEACDYEKGIKRPGIVVHERELPEYGSVNNKKE